MRGVASRLVILFLASSCTGGPNCRDVDASFVDSLEVRESPGEAAAVEYDMGIWLVAVSFPAPPYGDAGVWATDIDPSDPSPAGEVVIGANDIARNVSDLGIDVGPTATHPVAIASRDDDAVAEAYSCVWP
jgi:hypothetical protein